MKLSIVCASDDNFALPMTVTLYAALVNLDKHSEATIYIIDSGISDRNKLKIKHIFENCGNVSELVFLDKNLEENNNLYATESINKTTYLRILIPELLPQLDKVIYIDGDLIIEDDLTKIWNIPFDGNLASGIQDYYFPTVSTNNALENYKELNIDKDAPFCNAGVIVMNLTAWREENIGGQIMDYCESTNQNDQQGINAIFAGRWKLLDPRWNVTLSSINSLNNSSFYQPLSPDETRKKLLDQPAVIHFTSRYKPWHLGHQKLALVNNYYFQKERNRFYHYLKGSCWFTPLQFSLWVSIRRIILLLGIKIPHQLKHIFGPKNHITQ